MACLGGRAKLSVLEIAIAAPGRVPDILDPALRDGILVTESGAEEAVRFRHDRIREGVLSGLGPDRRAELHLAMARRLATMPDLFAVAAEQYLPVADAVTDPGERRAVAGLLRRAADEVTQIGEFPLVHALLTAALALADQADTDALIELHTVHHAALFSLGRLEEADNDYRALEELAGTVLDRPAATALQVKGLTNRNRFTEAIDLVIRSLRECGIDVPDAERMPAAIDRQFARLYQWLDHTDPGDDMARPDLTDPALLAAGSLLNAMLSPVYFVGDQAMFSWVGLEALRIWTEHGPGHTLVGSAANAAFHAITQRGDYAAAYRAARRILALGEARAYEPDTSHARLVVSLLDPWFEPVENSIQESLRAREGLLAGGDLANAGYTYHQTVVGLLDCGPTLDTCMAQVNAAQAFARRTGTGQTSQWLESYQWLSDVLRREGSAAAAEAIPADRYAGNPLVVIHVHLCRAIAAAIFGGVTCCSLLAVPVLGRGALRAVLLLENRLIRGAFTTGRLEAVGLIAGQLAVSLDNVQLYAGYRRIADEQAALRRVATLVARAEPPEAVFAAVAAEAGQLLAVDFAALIRYDEPDMREVMGLWQTARGTVPTSVGNRLPLGGHNVTTLVHRTRRAARTDRAHSTGVIGRIANTESRYHSACGVPVSVQSRLWGAILVGFMHDEVLPSDTEARLSGFAELVSTAIANAEARAEVAASRARIIAAADQVRQRIERDLHDGAQQRLVSLALRLRDAQADVPPSLASCAPSSATP